MASLSCSLDRVLLTVREAGLELLQLTTCINGEIDECD